MVPSLNMGGMEKMLVNVANLLVNQGNDVTVINLTSDSQAVVEKLNPNVKYLKKFVPVKFFLHSALNDIFNGNIRFLPYKYWTKIHSAKYLHKKYVKDVYDTEIAFYTGYCVKIIDGCPKSTKKIFWLHGEAWQMEGITQGYWRKNTAEKVYKNYNQIVCVSKRIENDFYKRFGNKTNVLTIPNLNDIREIEKKANEYIDLKTKSLTFILVGRIDNEHKGFDRVLDAACKLNKEGYKFDVWIVGDGKDYTKLTAQKNELKLDNVTLFGMQDNPYKFMNAADVFICSSHYEGYGLVVSEALILNKPVISTNVSGPAEILDYGKYGMVVDNDTDGIYKGMKAFLDDNSLLIEYEKKAKKRKDFFNPIHIGEMIQSII